MSQIPAGDRAVLGAILQERGWRAGNVEGLAFDLDLATYTVGLVPDFNNARQSAVSALADVGSAAKGLLEAIERAEIVSAREGIDLGKIAPLPTDSAAFAKQWNGALQRIEILSRAGRLPGRPADEATRIWCGLAVEALEDHLDRCLVFGPRLSSELIDVVHELWKRWLPVQVGRIERDAIKRALRKISDERRLLSEARKVVDFREIFGSRKRG